MKPRHALAAALLPVLAGCLATKRDLQDLQMRMDNDRAEQNRQIQTLITRTQAMLDSLSTQNSRMRADVANRLLQIDRQLVQIQSLSGQSQQQIRDLQRQLEQRAAEARQAQADADSAEAAATPAPSTDRVASTDRPSTDRPATPSTDRPASGTSTRPATDRPSSTTTTTPPPRSTTTTRSRDDAPPTADEAYQAAMGAYQRGSMTTARGAFQEFLRIAPSDRRAGEAQFYIGETYTRDPDAAIAAYQRVVERYPTSARAPAALLRIARLEIARGDRTQARTHLNQILRSYPRSDEAEEARTQLDRLGTR
ncbi:tetratricopeptide repeat protein [Longimicrobium sp.]|uniref:tetratricopeptide repeat protein n=1 Tax=Longimicrobium sp. TaxID=2029185 RepID=UPI002CF05779|nr:tetratricopeptide repeat protein [Longimicrobium sp.]HSU13360.1 tetratricopeptide repeat protein [Longimicrobium sp.]